MRAEKLCIADWTDLSVGIVGAGNVGGELARKLERLGFETVVCDPPKAEAAEEDDDTFASLEEALDCDVVTLHTPLIGDGSHPTYHLLDQARLAGLSENQLLINTSRGEVIDTGALIQRLSEPNAPKVVLDVWESEPRINPELAEQAWIATPHVAGYSLEGKVQGSEMIYQEVVHYHANISRNQLALV